MNKIIVSREVANFIKGYEENLASIPGWEDHLIMEHSRGYFNNFEGVKESAKCMNDISPLELSKILILGYEIKETPEDHLARLYHFPPKYLTMGRDKYASADIKKAYRDGIEIACKLMEIEVKGIHT